NERSHWSGNGVHVESELVFMIGRNMQSDRNNHGLTDRDDQPTHHRCLGFCCANPSALLLKLVTPCFNGPLNRKCDTHT
ncbi:hypothetical protein ACK31O_20445, partial [Aeromonas caviae]